MKRDYRDWIEEFTWSEMARAGFSRRTLDADRVREAVWLALLSAYASDSDPEYSSVDAALNAYEFHGYITKGAYERFLAIERSGEEQKPKPPRPFLVRR